MKTSQKGIELIKRHEGFRSKAYRCPAGVLTIGYGHTKNVKEGQIITESEGVDLLKIDLDVAEKMVNRELSGLNQNQFDALVSFVFNIGSGNFSRSNVLKKAKINLNDPTIVNDFAAWNKGGGKVLPGLVKRRLDEAELYFE